MIVYNTNPCPVNFFDVSDLRHFAVSVFQISSYDSLESIYSQLLDGSAPNATIDRFSQNPELPGLPFLPGEGAEPNPGRRATAEVNDDIYHSFIGIGGSGENFPFVPAPDFEMTELLRDVADALGVPPALAEDRTTTLEQKQAIGKSVRALIGGGILPAMDLVQFYESLSAKERSCISDTTAIPDLRAALHLRAGHPGYLLLPQALRTACLTPEPAEKFGVASRILTDKYHRVPAVFTALFTAAARAGLDQESFANAFSLKSLAAVAKLGSDSLLVLSAFMPLDSFSHADLANLAYLMPTDARLGKLIHAGFPEWFCLHRKDRFKDLEAVFEFKNDVLDASDDYLQSSCPVFDMQHWDTSLSAAALLARFRNAIGIRDCARYEADSVDSRSNHSLLGCLRFQFQNNELAIRGKGIVLRDRDMSMYMLPPDDYRNFSVGYDTHCCQHYGGAAHYCVLHAVSDPFAGIVVIEKNSKILAQSYVWVDEPNDTFVFDNIEFANDSIIASYANIIASYVAALPYSNVHLGTGYLAGNYSAWGDKVSSGKYVMANMPSTLYHVIPGRNIYSDYHSSARVLKANGKLLIRAGHALVEHSPEAPSRWDSLRDSKAKALLNVFELPVESRLATLSIQATPLFHDIVINYPMLTDCLDSVPEPWQQQILANGAGLSALRCIKNPIPAVRTAIISNQPDCIKSIPGATAEDWEHALMLDLSLTPDCPFPLSDECIDKLVRLGNPTAVMYLPLDRLSEDQLFDCISIVPRTVLLLDQPSSRLLYAALSADPLIITQIPEPDPDALAFAANLAPEVLCFFKHAPADLVARACVSTPALEKVFQFRTDVREILSGIRPYVPEMTAPGRGDRI